LRAVTTIYHTIDDGPITEFSVQRVKIKRRRYQTFAGNHPLSEAAYKHLRKAQPASEPLPGTFKWISRLPRNVWPLQLLGQFPRVANALAASWNHPESFRGCLYDLLVDQRGNRRGFPDEVVRELLALRAFFENSCL
jgi:hypothetical protein